MIRKWLVLCGLVGVALLSILVGHNRGSTASLRLILVIAVDQMRFDYLPRFAELYQGGFRRLQKDGAVFSNARFRHANTETGPGHAVILSGRHGSSSGIIANSWFDSYLKRDINAVDDPLQRPVGGSGRPASPVNFLGFTVGDVLKHKYPSSHVVTVSMKDRAAILMGGRRADAAYWYEVSGGNFITSTYYMPGAPAWLQEWNQKRPADSYASRKWERLLSGGKIYEKYAGPDAVEGEWDRKDIVFPHLIRGTPPGVDYYDYLRRTPFIDELTLSVALEALKAHRLGRHETPDLFAVSFSATDVIGHTYGPDSQELMDQMLRLDAFLEKLFKAVDAQAGLKNTLVVLMGDHGVQPLAEVLQGKGIPARRARPSEVQQAVEKALQRNFPGVSGIIARSMPPDYYLDEQVINRANLQRSQVEKVISQALLATGLVHKVYTQNDLLHSPAGEDPYWQLFRNSFFQPRSPHIISCIKEYIYLDERVGGTGHGTPHDYDRHVPIIFMGPGIKPGLFPDPCGPEDIAPTLAQLLGLQFPREPDSRLLLEMLDDRGQ